MMADIAIIEMAVCAISTALALMVEHYMLKYLLPEDIHRVLAYVLGVLAILVPASLVLWWHGERQVLALIWTSTVVGGLAVMGAYGIDGLVKRLRDWADERELRAYERGKDDAAARE